MADKVHHYLTLRNGARMCVVEGKDGVCICQVDPDGTDWFLCQITPSGILVFPNSGEGCAELCRER